MKLDVVVIALLKSCVKKKKKKIINEIKTMNYKYIYVYEFALFLFPSPAESHAASRKTRSIPQRIIMNSKSETFSILLFSLRLAAVTVTTMFTTRVLLVPRTRRSATICRAALSCWLRT